MNRRDIFLLFILAALWGASFLFIRIAAPVLNPAPLVEIRVVLAGIALVIYALISGQEFSVKAFWRPFLILGALNAAIPFTLVAFATLTITASLAAILNATTPLFTVLLSAVWLKEPLTAKKIVGSIGGIGGVLLIVGLNPVIDSTPVLLAVGAALLAPFSYAVAGVYAKKVSLNASPLTLAIGQQFAAGILLFPFAALTLPASLPSVSVVSAVLALALLSTAIGYLIFYKLIERIGATNTLSVTLLVPIFGMVWGAIILGEPISLIQIVGLIIILASLILVTNITFGKTQH